jgi:hypothetical protein
MAHHWIRWALLVAQLRRRVEPSSVADNQIGSYVLDCDYFVTADKRFAEALHDIVPHSPLRLAQIVLVRASKDTAPDIEDLFARVAVPSGDTY